MEREEAVNEKDSRRSSRGNAKLEQDIQSDILAKKGLKKITTPCRVVFYHYRKNLLDYDNLYTKSILDAVVRLGILEDDSPKYIQEISHKQIKSKEEKTLILIEEITGDV